MECNKDEAKRAMEIAEKKLSENDYVGAKKFVNKAQNLYPELDGLKQVLMMINVYISAASKINVGRETDWYGVLGVDPLADVETVKRQYKKLALLLHPDKNRFHGAEGAFKLVLNAWCLLSEKAKRGAYDQRRKLNTGMQKKPPPNQHKPASSNGYQNARDGVDPNGRARSNQPASGQQKPPYAHKPASSNGYQTAKDGLDPNARARNNQPASGQQKPPYAHKPASSNGYQNARATSNQPASGAQRPSCAHKPASFSGNQNARAGSNPPASGTQKPPNEQKKPASSSGNQNTRDGVGPSANTRSNKDAPVNSPNQWKGGTFWTMCNECKTRCEYRRDFYLNKAVLCPNCAKTYIATEKTPCASNVRSGNLSSFLLQQQWLRRLEQWNAACKARNKNTNGASSSRTNPSPSVGVTGESPSESYVKLQRQQQVLRARSLAEIMRRSFGATGETPHASVVRPVNLSSSCPQQQQQQGGAKSQATNKNTNGASSLGRVSSPSVSATAETPSVSSLCPSVHLSSFLYLQQQWLAQNSSGGTCYPSSSGIVHQNIPVSVTPSSKRVLEEPAKTLSAAERVSKKPRTDVK